MSDLQFVSDTRNGKPVRVWSECREVHEQLMANPTCFRVVDQPGLLDMTQDDRRVDAAALLNAVTSAATPDCPLALVPGKLLTVVQQLELSGRPQRVLVLNTHRLRNSQPREPIALGQVLSHWLATRFKLCCVEDALLTPQTPMDAHSRQAGYINYLEGAEDFDRPGDEAAAVRRIGQALQAARDSGADRIVVVDTGGLGRLKDPVALLAQMWFPGRVTVMRQARRGWRTPHALADQDRLPLKLLSADDVGLLVEIEGLTSVVTPPAFEETGALDADPPTAPASGLPVELSVSKLPAELHGRLLVATLVRAGDLVTAHAVASSSPADFRPTLRWRRAVALGSNVLTGTRLDRDPDLPWIWADQPSLPYRHWLHFEPSAHC